MSVSLASFELCGLSLVASLMKALVFLQIAVNFFMSKSVLYHYLISERLKKG